MGSPSETREVVTIGWDGHSHPIRRYRDELHLPDHERARPDLPDLTRARCFSQACRDHEASRAMRVRHG